MFIARLSLIMLFTLLGGCGQQPPAEDFGEVIYEIPDVPATEPPTAGADAQ